MCMRDSCVCVRVCVCVCFVCVLRACVCVCSLTFLAARLYWGFAVHVCAALVACASMCIIDVFGIIVVVLCRTHA